VQRLHVDGRLGCPAAAARTEYIRSAAFELRLPRRDLVGMNVELLGKLRNGSIALDGSVQVKGVVSR
jgi:hypothetical protein